MSAKLEKIENNTAEFTFELPTEEFEKGMDKAFAKNAKYFAVPGFRKGKAPRMMVEKMYGREVLYDDALNIALPDAYDKAVEELQLSPVDRPEVDIDGEIVKGESITIKVKVTVKPEVKLGKYKGISLEKIAYTVSDAQVDAEIAQLQEKGARLETVEGRAVQNGDIANINFEGFKDGVAFDGGKGENFDLTIGSGQFIPGFEDQLIGMETGEEKTINVTFPEDYQAEELKGAPVEFKVKINTIKVKELPELDDEFAKDVSEFDTLEDLKKDIMEKLTKQAADREKGETEAAAVEKATEGVEVEIPKCMMEAQLANIMRDYDMRLSQQGLSLQKYLEMTGGSVDAFKAQFEQQAEAQVKTQLTLEAIGKAENIDVTEDELNAEYEKMAEGYKMPVDDIKKYVPAEDLKQDLITRKVVEFLVANAKITEKKEKEEKKETKAKTTTKKSTAAKSTTAKKTTKTTKAKKEEE